jgi:hypothetical protein
MRTTVTLEDDVAAELAKLQKRRKLGFKEALNEALRAGIESLGRPRARARRVNLRVHDAGPCLIGEIASVSEALAVAEGEQHR